MDGDDAYAPLVQLALQFINAVFCPAKDDHFFKIFLNQEVVEDVDFVFPFGDWDDILVDIFGRFVLADIDDRWVSQQSVHDFLGFSINRRAEESAVALGRELGDQEEDVPAETDVEHAVDFVQNDVFKIFWMEGPALNEVFDSSRSADDKVGIVSQSVDLAVDVRATNTERGTNFQTAREYLPLFQDLDGELTRRRQNEDTLVWIVDDLGNQRQQESRGFAGSRVGDTNHVLAGQKLRNGLVLDRRWGLVPMTEYVLENLFIEPKIRE